MTREEFEGWIDAPDTLKVFKYLTRLREHLVGRLVEVAAGTSTVDELAVRTARLAGEIVGINNLLEIDYEEITNT